MYRRLAALLPLFAFLALWQLACQDSPARRFIFATPSSVLQKLIAGIANGTLVHSTLITAGEAVGGFILGTFAGTAIGFALLATPRLSNWARPYVFVIGAVPAIAIAPMMIVWFGIGFKMKLAMAFLWTVIVALTQAYRGGRTVDPDLIRLFAVYSTRRGQTFWKLVFPSSLEWVFASMRMNVNLALVGAFIGEFIASEDGLGYAMLKASGLYDVPLVLAGVLCFVALSAVLTCGVALLERHRDRIIGAITVPALFRNPMDL